MVYEHDGEDMRALREQVLQLQKDFYEHSKDVNKSLKQIFDFISQEIGARRERESNLGLVNRRAELTWTKLMAIAGIIGAFQTAPDFFRTFFH